MPYNVYLVDTMNRIGSDERRNAVKAALQPYFDDIVKQAKVAGGAIVSFVAANPQPKDHELIVYFCSENWHVVSQLPGASAVNIEPGGGLTVWNQSVTGSDVAADGKMEPRALANLAFHEMMHNKLHLGAPMHAHGGLAAATIDSSLRPSGRNIKAMAGVLMTKRSQWTGGFKELADRARPITP
jgi:hypothetical protein